MVYSKTLGYERERGGERGQEKRLKTAQETCIDSETHMSKYSGILQKHKSGSHNM